MPPPEVSHAGFHGFEIEPLGNMPGIGAEKDIRIRTVQDGVFIGFALGTETGMKIRWNVIGILDINVARGESVEPFSQGGRRNFRGRFEVAYLVKGMDACIGST
jgi:hypothetical protein